MNEDTAIIPIEIVPVCYFCRGSGIKGVAREDKRDNPPVEVDPHCGGSGEPPTDRAVFA